LHHLFVSSQSKINPDLKKEEIEEIKQKNMNLQSLELHFYPGELGKNKL